jgi:shikimate dehydrogenase
MSKFKIYIIGENPSKGARSPLLWNMAFSNYGLEYRMNSLDIPLNQKLNSTIIKIFNDPFFIGGAVTAPYKEKVAKILKNNLTTEAKRIGAVNCLFRKNNEIYGTNTDGEALLESIKLNYGEIKTKKILILGYGGAGKAIAAYISQELMGAKGRLDVAVRYIKSKKLYNFLNFDELKNVIQNYHIIINATSVGFGDLINKSPINLNLFKRINKNAFIYDIIYNPSETLLIRYAKKFNIDYLNGKDMNLRQAVLAFHYVIKEETDHQKTFKFMNQII